jgi:hypothetical protein
VCGGGCCRERDDEETGAERGGEKALDEDGEMADDADLGPPD